MKATNASLSTGNAIDSGVHLTHLIGEIVKRSIHPLQLRHDGIKSHTSYQGRRSRGGRSRRKRWNNRSCRIICLHTWPFWSKLGLAPLNKTSIDGTHGGEERRGRNGNVKMCEDTHDRKREDELITCRGIQVHI